VVARVAWIASGDRRRFVAGREVLALSSCGELGGLLDRLGKAGLT